MKKIFLLVSLLFAIANAYQYNIYDINGKKIGTYKEKINKAQLKNFVKQYHSSILVKKGTSQEFKTLENKNLAQVKQVDKNFELNSFFSDNEDWIEVEKNEIIKICLDNLISVWETPLNSSIINDSCITIQMPMFVGVESLNVYSPNVDSSRKINFAISLKYLDLKNEEVLLGYNTGNKGIRVTTKKRSYIAKEPDPERTLSITAKYLVDKYPITNCEILQLMWDSIPNNPTIKDSSYYNNEVIKKWSNRKKTNLHNGFCPVHDTAANTFSLYQAMRYANARSIREGLKPYYTFSDTQTDSVQIISKGQYIISYYDHSKHNNGFIQVSVDSSSDGYRLPYYDEWMMFARGGDLTKHAPWGNFSDSFEEVSKHAKFDNKKNYGESELVGQLQPNRYGLYDFLGLVEEHVLFEQTNPFNYYNGSPSCFKGGSIHSNWKKVNYGYTSANYYSANLGGFRLIRKLK
ncbi:SUMF1/EgtB/PvdO family nonheme iron enzyme [Fibrobacter sp. UWB11]|uniref:formylglycine-generating enzyme family protein n=1 Tax=Fibrobacter sp. UWB11 TaxID=1896202 RepID=UPI00092C7E24|nr:SUMF1/EgtB/PvdO family nonheme iron enzyme [Fibrobacter sp. UWB11]SIO06297.1 Sulfatase-modifying factor enzyme 1 [Fibrobacter sp. UWB11]